MIMTLSYILETHSHSMERILAGCHPFQIIQDIILLISVNVIGLETMWAWPYKGT